MEFRILGPLEVLERDRPVPLGGARQRALLALLLIRANEVVSNDRLLDELWGETRSESSANALQAAVSRLRRALQTAGNGESSAGLRTRAPGYVLDVAPEAIDAARFERLAAEGRQALAAGEAAKASTLLAEALGLWRGPALAEFTYEPFAQEAIARLEELRLATGEERIEAELACGRHAELVGELESLVARHRFRERPRAQLMLALCRSGRQSEALGVYREGRETMAEELGIEPGPQLKDLELKILRQDRGLLTPAPPPAPAAVEPPASAAAPAPAAAPEARKTVTVVFADLTESTELGERLDPEALRTVMGRYFAIAQEAFHRHGGTVEKFIGDAVMAVFGIPVLHEDDALRALLATAELQSGLGELNAELERGWGLQLALRIGVNTGEVIAGEAAPGQPLVTGDPVNTAARLQQAAGPGEILIGEPTHRLVTAAVEAEPFAPLALKGKAEPVAAWKLTRVIPGAAPFVRRLDAPLVGRQAELAQLHQAFERAVRERTAYLFTVLGAPGIGKTRLALEFSAAVEREATVLTGRCLAYGEGITYWPLRELLQAAFGDDVRAGIEKRLDGGADGREVAARLAAALGQVEQAFPSEEIRWAARTALEAVARTRPLLVVLEDLHWAEPTLLDLVDHVAELATDAPILLLCLARPELLEQQPAWGGGKRNATTLELEPLDDEEAAQLLGNLLRSAGRRGGEERIIAAAEGNPLFLEQIVAMLGEQTPGRSETPLPPTIHALLAARLERLGPGERAVLERAAIVGKEFTEKELAQLVPDEATPTLSRQLEGLVRRRFLRPARSTARSDRAFGFRHVLIQEAAYRSLPKRTRAELHERFAQWLEDTSPDRISELAEILGYHFELAYALRTELGPVDDRAHGLAARARAHLVAGGRRAMGRGDAPAAVRQLERAATLLPTTDHERLELLPRLGKALHDTGDLPRAVAVLDEAIELARAMGERPILAHALIERADVRAAVDPDGAMQELRDQADAAIRLFEEVGDERGLSRAWSRWSRLDQDLCRWAPYREANERALVHARRAEDELEVAEALGAIALALMHDPTPVPEAIARCEQIRREVSSSRLLEAGVLRVLGFLFGLQGKIGEARDHFARSREIYADLGRLRALGGMAMVAGQAELFADDPTAAEALLRQGQQILEEIGEKLFRSTVLAVLAKALYEQGRFEEAEQLAVAAQELGGSVDIGTTVEAVGVRARVHARRGDIGGGEAMLREALRLVDDTDMLWLQGTARMDLAEFQRLAGRPAEAIQAACEALALFEQKRADALSGRARAFLSELEGRQ
jgi:predicted ATPase/class 3 adenylate cyclase/DNA-binding SARP family transcriptional activator